MDWPLIWTVIGTGGTVVGLIYAFLRNFKADINSHIDAINVRIDKIDREWREESRKMDKRVMETNMRMDGVYNVLLKRTENQS